MRTLLLITLLLSSSLDILPAGRSTMPLHFVPNVGQAPEGARFSANGSGVRAFFYASEVELRVAGNLVRIRFDGANPRSVVEGRNTLPGQVNFLIGPEEEWKIGVPVFGGLVCSELYPGIDMTYGSNGTLLKSEFVVRPGSNPERIRFRYIGAGEPRVEKGDLVVPIGGHEIREQKPMIYQ